MSCSRLFALIGLSLGLLQAAVIDDFNRANSPTLGSAWNGAAAEIVGNRAVRTGGSTSTAISTYIGGTGNTAVVDIFDNGSSTQFIALILNYSSDSDNFFLKIQNNGGGSQFNNLGFYLDGNSSGGGGVFQSLSSPFSSARMTASVVGTAATLLIDTDFDGAADQTYNWTYGAAKSGTGIGLGFYGAAAADNFGTPGESSPVPEPATFVLVGLGLAGALGFRLRR